jgi:hypothetical protein
MLAATAACGGVAECALVAAPIAKAITNAMSASAPAV